MCDISILKGLTLTKIDVDKRNNEITFYTNSGRHFKMFGEEDQNYDIEAYIEDVCGDINDLIGAPILYAVESSNEDDDRGGFYSSVSAWTFYKLATIKGWVDIRWYSDMDQGYSAEVLFEEIV